MTIILSIDVGIRNLAYCLAHYSAPSSMPPDLVRDTKVISLGLLDVTAHLDPEPKYTNLNKIPIFMLARALLRTLKTHVPAIIDKLENPVDYVVIENQPCIKNPKMKSIQMIIFGYFVGLTVDTPPICVQNVCMFNPRDKLSVYTGEPVECTLKSKYGRRKRLSEEYTRRMLACHPKILQIFETTEKKDDIADAYLQALTFLKRKCKTKKRRGPRIVISTK